MTWALIDDRMCFHPKVLAAGNAAFGAWCRMLCWVREHKTDGEVAMAIAMAVAMPAEIELLVQTRLLDRVDDGGLRIHDYLDHMHSSDKLTSIREKRAENGKRGASKRWGDGKHDGKSHGKHDGKSIAPPPPPPSSPTGGSEPPPAAAPKAARGAKPKTAPTPEAAEAQHNRGEVLGHYAKVFLATRGFKPAKAGAAEARAALELVDRVGGLDGAKLVIDAAFADPFWRDKVTLLSLRSDPDKFRKGASQQQPLTAPDMDAAQREADRFEAERRARLMGLGAES